MKKTLIISMLFFILSGCVPSLYPIYTEKDVISDEGLIGVWSEKDSDATWQFDKEADNSYLLTYTMNNQPNEFEVHLTDLGNFKVLDLFPKELNCVNDFYKIHFLAVHTFIKYDRKDNALGLTMMDPEATKNFFEEKKVRIDYKKVEDGIFFTEETPGLRNFVNKYADRLFSDKPGELQKKD